MRVRGGELLVYDEDGATEKVVLQVLEESRFDVQLCTSQAACITSIQQHKPDLVLISLTTNSSSGISLLGKIREISSLLPVVVLANNLAIDQVMPCLEKGADDYVLSPLKDTRILNYVLNQTLDRRREMKRRRRNERELAKSNKTLLASLETLEEDQQAGFRVQQGMMPDTPVAFDVLTLSHYLKPSLILSGDCIDYFELPDGRVLFYIGDVSGHGAAGAIVTVILKGLFHRLVAEFEQLPASSTADIMTWLNGELINARLEQHVAMFLGLINGPRDMLEYTNAGHFPRTILNTQKQASYLAFGGLPLGMSPKPTYKSHRVEMPQNCELVMFSDGVFEVMDEKTLDDKENQLLSLVNSTCGDVDYLAEKLGLAGINEVPDDIAIFTVARAG